MRFAVLTLLSINVLFAAGPPVIPIGWDAYRAWDRWPELRIGVRTYMRSTYDRQGGNEGADASHFLYQLAEDRNVSLDIEGPGALTFVRFNHWHGSPWHFEIDGADHVISETSTADPLHPNDNSIFLPERLFRPPFALTWALTKGADLSWVPMPFEKSLRIAYSRTHYGTGYYIYSQYVPGAKLSRPLASWSEESVPDPEAEALLNRAGSDIGPQQGLREETGRLDAKPGWTSVFTTKRAPGIIRVLELSAPRESALEFGRMRLRITWDGRTAASVQSPLALFFGAGTLYNRENAEYLVKSLPMSIRFDAQRVYLACYFPMPFFRSAQIDLGGAHNPIADVRWKVRYGSYNETPERAGYFHATYRDHPEPDVGHDLVLLDTREAEGAREWSGHLVGTSFIFSHAANLTTLEGDPRFFFDDSRTPQVQGTGTEEWGGGGDYWGGRNMTLPFAGHPVGARNPQTAVNEEDKIESAYRFLLADLMPFGRNALIRLEHGGTNESAEHYETVAYWYGTPAASLVKTDELKIGDAESERSHKYVSPAASAPYSITSRYEEGVDTLHGKTIYPEETDIGRTTKTTSEFTLKTDPLNYGVLLRRKLDYAYPDQRAEIWIRSAKDWELAGLWYLAGSNTCVYSNPRGELDPAQHAVKTSNRRFRDDEFLVPLRLTQGRKTLQVRVKYTPVNRPLFPGAPAPESAWTELKYTAYSFVMPHVRKLGK